MAAFGTLLKVIYIVICALLIMGVLFSQQKSGGLSGIMGGMYQGMRGVKGMDEGMRRGITWLGLAFVGLAVIIDLLGV